MEAGYLQKVIRWWLTGSEYTHGLQIEAASQRVAGLAKIAEKMFELVERGDVEDAPGKMRRFRKGKKTTKCNN